MPRYDLPDDLGDAFSVANALTRGVSRKRLRGSDLERPYHGVRARLIDADEPGEDGPTSPFEVQRRSILRRVAQYAERMAPGEFFIRSTAALIWGAPVPFLRDELPHVAVLAPGRAVRSAGVHAHEAQPHLTRVVLHAELGVNVASPASTWASIAAELRHPYDIVAVGDHLVRVPRMPGGFDKPLGRATTTPQALRAALFAGRRVGGLLLREALPRIRTGSSSRPETWMRLLLVDAGLPEPVLDHDVFADDGTFVGCVDGAYPRLKIALEYEGDHHRTDPDTWNRDIRKHDALAALGWRVIRVTRGDVFVTAAPLVARVRVAIRGRS